MSRSSVPRPVLLALWAALLLGAASPPAAAQLSEGSWARVFPNLGFQVGVWSPGPYGTRWIVGITDHHGFQEDGPPVQHGVGVSLSHLGGGGGTFGFFTEYEVLLGGRVRLGAGSGLPAPWRGIPLTASVGALIGPNYEVTARWNSLAVKGDPHRLKGVSLTLTTRVNRF